MKNYTDHAMKFTMDGGIPYEYKDEDDEQDANVDYKSLIGGSAPSNVYPIMQSQTLS